MNRTQNMVDSAHRTPAWEYSTSTSRLPQIGVFHQQLHLIRLTAAVHVTHHNRMPLIGNQLADKLNLAQTCAAPQCQVHDAYTETLAASVTAHDHAFRVNQVACTHLPGVGRILLRSPLLCWAPVPIFTIGLLEPERKLGAMGKICRLIQETAAQTAGIDLLQAHNIERSDHVGDKVQIYLSFTVRKYVCFHPGSNNGGTFRIDPCLNVVAQQPQPLVIFLFHQSEFPYRNKTIQPYLVTAPCSTLTLVDQKSVNLIVASPEETRGPPFAVHDDQREPERTS